MDRESSRLGSPLFDREELVARCLGNLELAERILSKFQTRFEEDLAELDGAVTAGNTELVAAVAHRLKGASANASAHTLRDRTAEIEELARRRAFDEVPLRLQRLREDWRRFTEQTLPRSRFSNSALPIQVGRGV